MQAFKALIKYIVADAAAINPLDIPLCLEVLRLAEKYQMGRLMLLVQKASPGCISTGNFYCLTISMSLTHSY